MTKTAPIPALTDEQITLARDWIKDCIDIFADLETETDVDELTYFQVVAGVHKHHSGGIQGFLETCSLNS